jgi:PIN domain nuclease of toxin-antitoxin system
MKAILDTHAFLWAVSGDNRLSRMGREIFTGPSNLWFSIASLWEIVIRVQTGKLLLPALAGRYIARKLVENRIELLPLSLDHLIKLESLPMHHRDPFDRVLIAQSMEEGWPIITGDLEFKKYPIRVIW